MPLVRVSLRRGKPAAYRKAILDGIYRAMGFQGRDPARPQFTDHCFTGDYPTPLTDLAAQEASPRQLSLLAEAICILPKP